MNEEPNKKTRALGADIKAQRVKHDLSIMQLAQKIDRSTGWVSQIERGVAIPSIADLRILAAIFDTKVSWFFGLYEEAVEKESERGIVVRNGARRTLGNEFDGFTEELLTPHPQSGPQIIATTLSPRRKTTMNTVYKAKEVLVIIAGTIIVEMNQIDYRLNAGDTITIDGMLYQCRNAGATTAKFHRILSKSYY